MTVHVIKPGFHPEKFCGGSCMQKRGEAASLHLVILLFPIEVTHSSWVFWGGSWGFWGGSFPPSPPLDKTLKTYMLPGA